MSTEPPIDEAIADIRAALDGVKETRNWHIREDAIRDGKGTCIAWLPARAAQPAFNYVVAVRPEVMQALLDELERLHAQGRRAARRAAAPEQGPV